MAESDQEAVYECIGVCMADPVSGLCQGCGRPLAEPATGDDEPYAVPDRAEPLVRPDGAT